MFLIVVRIGFFDGEIVVYSVGECGVFDNWYVGIYLRYRNYEEIWFCVM